MYTVSVSKDFIAQHHLIGGDWGSENSPHSHHYVAEVQISSMELDQHGYLVDIVDIEESLDAIVAYFQDSSLNDKPEFSGLNPSIEHFSRILTEKLLATIKTPDSGSLRVKLWENDTCWASFVQEF